MKVLTRCYLALVLSGCGGDPFTPATSADAARDVHDAGDELAADARASDAGEVLDSPWDTMNDAGDVRDVSASRLADAADASPDVAGDVRELDQVDAGAVDAGLPCDSTYGDASPGGPCCVHVWATPSMGAVLCTVDGSRWCWQTGMPCSPFGSRCVVQGGVSYCAP
jgi:hypothetical protein